MNISEASKELVQLTDPENFANDYCHWNDRMGQAARIAGLDVTRIDWSSTPQLVAFSVMSQAERYKAIEAVLAAARNLLPSAQG